MCAKRSSTCRLCLQACRQVRSGTPSKGGPLSIVVLPVSPFKGAPGTVCPDGMRISLGVPWVEPCRSQPSSRQTLRNKTAAAGLATRPHVFLRPQTRCQLGSVPPGPADWLGEAAATNGQRGYGDSVLPRTRRRDVESAQVRPSQKLGTTSRNALERQGALAAKRYAAADELVGNHTLAVTDAAA